MGNAEYMGITTMKVFVALCATIAAASAAPRYLVIDLQASNGMDQAYLSGLPVMRNPVLARQARMAQEEQDTQDSNEYDPYAPFYPGGYTGGNTGGYTGGYGAMGWYTDDPNFPIIQGIP